MNSKVFHQILFEGDDLYKNEVPSLLKSGKYIVLNGEKSLSTSENDLLAKILSSIDIKTSETELIQLTDQPLDFEKYNSSLFFIFGELDQGIPSEKYTVQKIKSNLILLSDRLEKLENDRDLKSRLWNAIKDLKKG